MLDVDARDRFVVAKYFGRGTRATREMVRAFAAGALHAQVCEHGEALAGRSRSAYQKLANVAPARPGLAPPREHQLSLLSGEGDAEWTS